MGEIIYDKLVYGRDLTPEQWSKLQYRPLDDKDMYGIAENPSFGIDKSLIGGNNKFMEIVNYYNDQFIIGAAALYEIDAEHETHQYTVDNGQTFQEGDFMKIHITKIAPESAEISDYFYILQPVQIDEGRNLYNLGVYVVVHEHNFIQILDGIQIKLYSKPQTYQAPAAISFSNDRGSVSVSPQHSSYEAFTPITITATPNEGYTFVCWRPYNGETALSTDNPWETISGAAPYEGYFGSPVTITVEAEPADGGTVSGGGTYAEGSEITISATPNEGFIFLGWYNEGGNLVSEDNPWQLEAGNDTYIARFMLNQPLNAPVIDPEYVDQETTYMSGENWSFTFPVTKGQNNPSFTKLFGYNEAEGWTEIITNNNIGSYNIDSMNVWETSGEIHIIETTENSIPDDIFTIELPTNRYSTMATGTYVANEDAPGA